MHHLEGQQQQQATDAGGVLPAGPRIRGFRQQGPEYRLGGRRGAGAGARDRDDFGFVIFSWHRLQFGFEIVLLLGLEWLLVFGTDLLAQRLALRGAHALGFRLGLGEHFLDPGRIVRRSFRHAFFRLGDQRRLLDHRFGIGNGLVIQQRPLGGGDRIGMRRIVVDELEHSPLHEGLAVISEYHGLVVARDGVVLAPPKAK